MLSVETPIAQAGSELSKYISLAMNFPSSCLYFLTTRIIGENHHTRLFIHFQHRVGLCSPGWPFRVEVMVGGRGCSVCGVPTSYGESPSPLSYVEVGEGNIDCVLWCLASFQVLRKS